MSKRKPIYIVRMEKAGLTVTGSLTVETGAYFTDAARRRTVAAFVKRLRSIGLEASPKQVEVNR